MPKQKNIVSYCMNPWCQQRQNPNYVECCQTCGNNLFVNERYRLVKPLRELRQEQYSEVFEVDDRGTRKVLKILKEDEPKLIEMLQREASVLSTLKHPGIPRIDPDGYFTITLTLDYSYRILHCLVLEKIEGQNLWQWLEQNQPISQKQALVWLQQLVEILALVHENKLFHRDIKPSNIMLKPDGQLVLIDFGSVKYGTKAYLNSIRKGFEGTIILSSGYTPPEQIEGKAVKQSDFYALGRTFVNLLTGRPPSAFVEDLTTGQLIWRDRAPEISKPLADLIDSLMAVSPNNRPENTRFILQRLEKISRETDELMQAIESSIRSSLSQLPPPVKYFTEKILKKKLQRLAKQSRIPKIALYGRSGAGKSSLINAILGRNVTEVGLARATTQVTEIYDYERNGWKLRFVDSRGVGDSRDHAAFEQAINEVVQNKVDIFLFVIPADERAYVPSDIDFLTELKSTHKRKHGIELPVILVLNKIDRIQPTSEWNPPYNVFDSQIRDAELKTARQQAKEANIRDCVMARITEYKTLSSMYVHVCTLWDEYDDKRYNVEELALQIYKCIPDEAGKQGFGGATAAIALKRAVARDYTFVAACLAFIAGWFPFGEQKGVLSIQRRLVSMIAQIATNADQSNEAEKLLRQLGVQQGDTKSHLSTTLAIGEAAIRYFIEQDSTIEQAQQAFAEEKERREPEFQEALKGGTNKVVSKLREIDQELYERYGLPRIYDDD
ncbi:protein kinase domain-containing protein [Brasilonema sennae]|uniref:protein kinase domain-containing protein n=1 Tax=Brasilonema sennae TaxID=1397703 RepID=UPI00155A6692|nr:protein kinase [Brasilonema sennae]